MQDNPTWKIGCWPIKKNIHLLCVVILSFVTQTLFAVNVQISGHIQNKDISEVRLNNTPPPISDGWSVTQDPDDIVVTVDENGHFKRSLELNKTQFYRLSIADQTIELLIEPDSGLDVTITTDDERPIRFSGTYAAQNQFLWALSGQLDQSEQYIGKHYQQLFSLSLEDFNAQIDALKQDMMAQRSDFLAKHANSSAAFIQRTQIDIDSKFSHYKLLYPLAYQEVNARKAQVKSDYFETLSQGVFNHPDSLSSSRFIGFLNAYVDWVSANELKLSNRNLPREKLLSRYQAIKSLAGADEINQYLLDQMFQTFRTSYGPKDWGIVFKQLIKDAPDHPVIKQYQPLYEQDMAIRDQPDEIRVFKKVNGVSLEAHLFYPKGFQENNAHSAYLFFHGGGWAIGTPEWGYGNARTMADRGMLAITFEYRLADVHGSDLFACIEDVQSAISWARQHADEFRINPEKIVAAGFSAGAHLAAAAAILKPSSTLPSSAIPNALIMHSSSYNLTKSSFFEAMTGGKAKSVSLYHQLKPGLVPSIFFHGVHDHLAPISEFEEFIGKMQSLDNDFEHHIFQNTGHFFRNPQSREEVKRLTEAFLSKRGF